MNTEPIKLNDLSEYQELVDKMVEWKPVKNLTKEEALTTIRLFEIQLRLGDPNWERHVDVFKNDKRMEGWSDEDKFLALLLETDQQDLILSSKRCIYCFGGTKYHWRKIGRTSPVTDVVSALSECYAGYYGRGWIIAPHINTLLKWMVDHPATKYFFNK